MDVGIFDTVYRYCLLYSFAYRFMRNLLIIKHLENIFLTLLRKSIIIYFLFSISKLVRHFV